MVSIYYTLHFLRSIWGRISAWNLDDHQRARPSDGKLVRHCPLYIERKQARRQCHFILHYHRNLDASSFLSTLMLCLYGSVEIRKTSRTISSILIKHILPSMRQSNSFPSTPRLLEPYAGPLTRWVVTEPSRYSTLLTYQYFLVYAMTLCSFISSTVYQKSLCDAQTVWIIVS